MSLLFLEYIRSGSFCKLHADKFSGGLGVWVTAAANLKFHSNLWLKSNNKEAIWELINVFREQHIH